MSHSGSLFGTSSGATYMELSCRQTQSAFTSSVTSRGKRGKSSRRCAGHSNILQRRRRDFEKSFSHTKLIEQKNLANLITLRAGEKLKRWRRAKEFVRFRADQHEEFERARHQGGTFSSIVNKALIKVIPEDIVVEFYLRKSHEDAKPEEDTSAKKELERLLLFLPVEIEWAMLNRSTRNRFLE